MAKKKTVKTKKPTPPKPEVRSKLLAAIALKWLDGEDDPVAALHKALAMDEPTLAKLASGDLLPTEEQLKLMEALAEANGGIQPGEPVKKRGPSPKESKHLKSVLELQDLTHHPAWARIVKWLNTTDAALTLSLRECKPADLKLIQGQIKAFEDFRNRICKPAEELGEFPVFESTHMAKVDREKLVVTASAR